MFFVVQFTPIKKVIEEQIIGKVKVNEAYFGASSQRGLYGELKRSRGTLKQPVFAIFERDGKRNEGLLQKSWKDVMKLLIHKAGLPASTTSEET